MVQLTRRKGKFVATSKNQSLKLVGTLAVNFYTFIILVVGGVEWSSITSAVNSSALSQDSF
jgi:hypothetical protein